MNLIRNGAPKARHYESSMRLFFCILLLIGHSISAFGQKTTDSVRFNAQIAEIEVQHARIKDTNYTKAHALVQTEEMLGRVPELQLIRRGPFAMEPTIRSFSSGQIQVNLDGMRIHGACTDRMDPATSYIEPINIDYIQSNTSNQASAFGSNIGGALVIGLRQPIINPEKPVSAQVGSGFGSAAHQWSQMAAINVSLKRTAFRISGVHRKAHNYLAGGGQLVPFSQFEKYNILLSAKQLLGTSSYLKADILLDEGRNIGYPALAMDVGLARAITSGISYHYVPCHAGKPQVTTKVYANWVYHVMDDSERPNPAYRMAMPGWSRTYGAFTEMEWSPWSKHTLTLKPEAYLQFVKAEMYMYPKVGNTMYMLSWPDNERIVTGIYLRYRFDVNAKTAFNITLRPDLYRTYPTSNLGKDQMATVAMNGNTIATHVLWHSGLSVSHRVSKWVEAQAALMYSERAPTVSELLGFYLYNAYDGFDQIGNYNLRKERSWQTEGKIQLKKRSWQLQAQLFTNRVEDYILGIQMPGNEWQPMTFGARGVRMFFNSGTAYLSGGEYQASWQVHPLVRCSQMMRYVQGWFESGEAVPLIAPFRSLQLIRVGSSSRYVQFECDASAPQNRINAAFGDKATPAFAIAHIRANTNYKIGGHTIEIGGGIENLFDAKYREHLDWGGIPRMGRNFYINLSYIY